MLLYPKIAFRLGAKSKAETFGLFAFHPCYFYLSAVCLPNEQLFSVIEETVSLTQC